MDFAEKEIKTERRFYRKIVGVNFQHIRQVRLVFDRVQIIFPYTSDKNTNVLKIRGPKEHVDEAFNYLDTFHDGLKEQSLLAEKTIVEDTNEERQMRIEPWFQKKIVGNNGANLRQIRARFNEVVFIFSYSFDENKEILKLRGPKRHVDAAFHYLEEFHNGLVQPSSSLARKSNVIEEKEIKTERRFYKKIVGANYEHIRQVRFVYDQVQIIFPYTSDKNTNVLKIRGPKEHVDEAFDYLDTFHNELKEQSSFLAESPNVQETIEERQMNIEPWFQKKIVGDDGENLRQIMARFDEVVFIFSYSFDENKDILKLRGPKRHIDAAFQYLEEFHDELIATSYSIKLPVCKIFHQMLIGNGGAHIDQLSLQTSTQIHVPDATSKSKLVTIIGSKSNVEQARNLVLKFQRDQIIALIDEIETEQPEQGYQFHKYRLANIFWTADDLFMLCFLILFGAFSIKIPMFCFVNCFNVFSCFRFGSHCKYIY